MRDKKEQEPLDFCATIQGKQLKLFSLSFNKKRELFYVFPNNSSLIIQYHSANESKLGRMYDHVSFHNSGKIHTMFKSLKKEKDYIVRGDNPGNVFDLKDDAIFPLMIQSFYFKTLFDKLTSQTSEEILKTITSLNKIFPEVTPTNNVISWDMNPIQNFSTIIVLLGRKLNPENVLHNPALSHLPNLHKRQQIVFPWSKPPDLHSDSKLWIMFSDKTLSISEEESAILKNKMSAKKPALKISEVSSFGVCPPWPELSKLI